MDRTRKAPQIRFSTLYPAGPTGEVEAPAHATEPIARVLVMDDDAMVRETIGTALSRLGCRTDFAADGERALQMYGDALAARDPYALVVMDLRVEQGPGARETIGGLLELDPEARAIISSGYSYDATVADYRKHGFVDVLIKPYRLARLQEVLQKHVPAFQAKRAG